MGERSLFHGIRHRARGCLSESGSKYDQSMLFPSFFLPLCGSLSLVVQIAKSTKPRKTGDFFFCFFRFPSFKITPYQKKGVSSFFFAVYFSFSGVFLHTRPLSIPTPLTFFPPSSLIFLPPPSLLCFSQSVGRHLSLNCSPSIFVLISF